MATATDAPQGPRSFPSRSNRGAGGRALSWLRANLFSSISSSLITLFLILLLGKMLISFAQWGIWDCGLERTGQQHRRVPRGPADLALLGRDPRKKFRFIIFGTYPYDEQWRPRGCER